MWVLEFAISLSPPPRAKRQCMRMQPMRREGGFPMADRARDLRRDQSQGFGVGPALEVKRERGYGYRYRMHGGLAFERVAHRDPLPTQGVFRAGRPFFPAGGSYSGSRGVWANGDCKRCTQMRHANERRFPARMKFRDGQATPGIFPG